VDHCPQCRRELNRLKHEAQRFLAAAAPLLAEAPRLAGSLDILLCKVHKLQSAHRRAIRPKMQEHLAFQLRTFFGSRAAALIGNKTAAREEGSGVFSTVEPLLSAFLGQRAAALLANRVVEGLDLNDHPETEPVP
jgi:hypothetical protein